MKEALFKILYTKLASNEDRFPYYASIGGGSALLLSPFMGDLIISQAVKETPLENLEKGRPFIFATKTPEGKLIRKVVLTRPEHKGLFALDLVEDAGSGFIKDFDKVVSKLKEGETAYLGRGVVDPIEYYRRLPIPGKIGWVFANPISKVLFPLAGAGFLGYGIYNILRGGE